jgi:hypothetical protein
MTSPTCKGYGTPSPTRLANAFAGLSGHGRLFIAFLAGAAVGLGIVVTAGGVFLGVLGAIAAGAIAGALAFEVLGTALDFATAGASGIGALIGGGLAVAGTGAAAAAGAGAGGLATLLVAGGAVDKLTAAMKPFVEVLIGTFNAVGDKVIPRLQEVATALLPSMSRFLESAIQYLEPIAGLLAAFAANILPPLLDLLAVALDTAFPFVVVLGKMAEVFLVVVGAIASVTVAMVRFMSQLNIVNALFRAVYGGPSHGQPGNAPAPITGASFIAVEEAFKRAQEQALLGSRADKETPIERQDVIGKWAKAMGDSVGKAIWENAPQWAMAAANPAQALAIAFAKGSVRTPGN